MQNTTNQRKDKKVNLYCKQYLSNYRGLNMEFTEFMASKLRVTESDVVTVIRNWKKTLIIQTENK